MVSMLRWSGGVIPIGDDVFRECCSLYSLVPYILWNAAPLPTNTFGTKEYNSTTCLRLTYSLFLGIVIFEFLDL